MGERASPVLGTQRQRRFFATAVPASTRCDYFERSDVQAELVQSQLDSSARAGAFGGFGLNGRPVCLSTRDFECECQRWHLDKASRSPFDIFLVCLIYYRVVQAGLRPSDPSSENDSGAE